MVEMVVSIRCVLPAKTLHSVGWLRPHSEAGNPAQGESKWVEVIPGLWAPAGEHFPALCPLCPAQQPPLTPAGCSEALTSPITAMGVSPVALATRCSTRSNLYSSYSRRIRWKEPKLAALRRVRSLITMELGDGQTEARRLPGARSPARQVNQTFLQFQGCLGTLQTYRGPAGCQTTPASQCD